MATLTPESDAGVGVGRKRRLLRRCSHCLSVPISLGIVLRLLAERMTGNPEAETRRDGRIAVRAPEKDGLL
jgi:hypothetical protein